MFDVLDDTIVAISSALGNSPRGIVRLCGPEAIAIAERLFRPDEEPSLGRRDGHTCFRGLLRLVPPADDPAVPCEAYLFREPRSYTRQDIVELHTLGSPPILSVVLQYAFAEGARLAEPGEFTARAFFGGGLDLSEVEGVAALIHAESDVQLRAGERLLHGALSTRAAAMQDRLSDVLALVEADIDFAEEPIDFIAPEQLRRRVAEIAGEIRDLLASSQSSERLETLPRVMLVGPPNVGKSSLLNRLGGLDRAICSPLPGTTRDVLTAPLEMGRSEAILVDAAGLGRTETYIDRLADQAVQEAVAEAALVLFVIDAAERRLDPHFELLRGLGQRRRYESEGDLVRVAHGFNCPELRRRSRGEPESPQEFVSPTSASAAPGTSEEVGHPSSAASSETRVDDAVGLDNRPCIVLLNKIDLVGPDAVDSLCADIRERLRVGPTGSHQPTVLPVSAKTGAGCDRLIAAIEDTLHRDTIDSGSDAIALKSRHRHALTSAAEALDRAADVAADLTDTLDAAELIALELRQANDDLGQMAGEVVTDDLLGRIFEGFCIGK